MKIDAHQHFWNYGTQEYSWMKEGMEILQRDFTPQDLAAARAEIGFDGSVAVQARMTLDETRRLLELAAEHETIRGVVGYVDTIKFQAANRTASLSCYIPVEISKDGKRFYVMDVRASIIRVLLPKAEAKALLDGKPATDKPDSDKSDKPNTDKSKPDKPK